MSRLHCFALRGLAPALLLLLGFGSAGAKSIDVFDQASLDLALESASDGDTVTIRGDGIQEGVARITAGIHLRCEPPYESSLRRLTIIDVLDPVTLTGILFTGEWEYEWWNPDPSEPMGAVAVANSKVRFEACRFEEFSFALSAESKRKVNGLGVVQLEDSYVEFLLCRFHRVNGSITMAEGPSWGVISQRGTGQTRFVECEFEDLGIPIRSQAPVEVDASRFLHCQPGLIDARSDLILTNSLIVMCGPLLYQYDDLSFQWETSHVIKAQGEVRIEGNTFVDNPTATVHWGYYYELPDPRERIPLVDLGPNSTGRVSRNLFIRQTAPALHAPSAVHVSCNDTWQTNGEAWTGGIGDVTGIDGNISEAPIFCGRSTGDYTLSVHSPAATADCGLMGAFPTDCSLESPVAIQGFTASWEGAGVLVRWELAGSESPEVLLERLDARGLHEIYRGREGGFLDLDPPEGELFRYALGFIQDGERQSGVAWAIPTGEPLTRRTRLIGAVPNPFNPRTEIRFELAQAGPIKLEIFDAAGRRVQNWSMPSLDAGQHSVVWYGFDQSETKVASGVYYLRLDAEGRLYTERLVLLR